MAEHTQTEQIATRKERVDDDEVFIIMLSVSRACAHALPVSHNCSMKNSTFVRNWDGAFGRHTDWFAISDC